MTGWIADQTDVIATGPRRYMRAPEATIAAKANGGAALQSVLYGPDSVYASDAICDFDEASRRLERSKGACLCCHEYNRDMYMRTRYGRSMYAYIYIHVLYRIYCDICIDLFQYACIYMYYTCFIVVGVMCAEYSWVCISGMM